MTTRNAMRHTRGGALLALVALASGITAGTVFAQPEIYGGAYANVSMEAFDAALTPYGEWVAVGRFGRAWRPFRTIVGIDFQPYLTGGHWVYTDYGWTFESDYDWGWAPFHYGRWMMDDYYGWVWIPDTVWGPSWVDWRFGGGYVGWAPLPPAGFSISFAFGRPAWCFVPVTHFVVRDVYHYALPADRFHWAYSVTSAVHQPVHYAGAQWNGGPPPGQVSQAIGRPIQPVSISPPPPGQVRAAHLGSPAGVPATFHGATPAGSAVHAPAPPPSGSTGFGGRSAGSPPTPRGAPVTVGSPQTSAPPPSAAGEAHWGHAAAGGAPPWGRSTQGSVQGQPQSQFARPPPVSAHPWTGGAVPQSRDGFQGFRPMPSQMSAPPAQYRAPPPRPFVSQQPSAPMRATPPPAPHSAPIARSFAPPAASPSHFSGGHASGGFGARLRR
jgi:hypothetical protein